MPEAKIYKISMRNINHNQKELIKAALLKKIETIKTTERGDPTIAIVNTPMENIKIKNKTFECSINQNTSVICKVERIINFKAEINVTSIKENLIKNEIKKNKIEFISSKNISLAHNKVNFIHGPAGTGKTTMLLEISINSAFEHFSRNEDRKYLITYFNKNLDLQIKNIINQIKEQKSIRSIGFDTYLSRNFKICHIDQLIYQNESEGERKDLFYQQISYDFSRNKIWRIGDNGELFPYNSGSYGPINYIKYLKLKNDFFNTPSAKTEWKTQEGLINQVKLEMYSRQEINEFFFLIPNSFYMDFFENVVNSSFNFSKIIKKHSFHDQHFKFLTSENHDRDTLIKIYKKWMSLKQASFIKTFNDVAILATKNQPKGIFDYIFVDEYQDLSMSKIEFILNLKNESGTICCCYDPCQRIFNTFFDSSSPLPEILKHKYNLSVSDTELTNIRRSGKKIYDLAQNLKSKSIYAHKYNNFTNSSSCSGEIIFTNTNPHGQMNISISKTVNCQNSIFVAKGLEYSNLNIVDLNMDIIARHITEFTNYFSIIVEGNSIFKIDEILKKITKDCIEHSTSYVSSNIEKYSHKIYSAYADIIKIERSVIIGHIQRALSLNIS